MTINSQTDLDGLMRIGRIVAHARDEMIRTVKPGITTKELDDIAHRILADHGAKSAPKHEYGFPGETCISINDEVAHGIPGSRAVASGDNVNIDVSAVMNGYYADTGATVVAGEASGAKKALLDCSITALLKAIAKARAGTRLNQIGRTIWNHAKGNGYTVLRDLCGHGIGRRLHEEPDVLNYFEVRDNRILNDGLVLAIETFVSTGAEHVVEERNGWTLRTPDHSIVAQFEHTVVVTCGEPIIVTAG